MPEDAPRWLTDKLAGKTADQQSEILWNAVEKFERRKDAQLSRETVVALPKELTREQNIEVAREFVSSLTERGQVADWAFHDEPGNPHIHIMTTLRPLTQDGFGAKRVPLLDDSGEVVRSGAGKQTRDGENKNSRIVSVQWNGAKDDLKAERALWQDVANAHLLKHGHSETIDHRSFADRGIALEPTIHRGQIEEHADRNGGVVTAEVEAIANKNMALLIAEPNILLDQLTENMSVFDADDIARKAHTYVQDPNAFQGILARLVNSDDLVRLSEEVKEGGQTVKAKYTTRGMIELERGMADRALGMAANHTHQVSAKRVERAIVQAVKDEDYSLSEQQAGAVHSITGPQQLASIVGLAGAGKSTLLKAANLAWNEQGYNPIGLSLAGKAVDELEKSSGIEGRTIASLEYRLKHGMQTITEKDVFVVDEAGMVGSRMLDRLLATAQAAGAKVVLVGDYDQLPAISAGAAFRAIVERTGYYEVSEIHRQSAKWMKQASLDFARGNIKEALGAYQENLAIGGFKLQDEAMDALAADFATKYVSDEKTLALAHSNKMVQELNDRIRSNLKEQGAIGESFKFETAKSIEDRAADKGGPADADYRYDFGEGDRIVFLQNDTLDGVKVRNGQLGRVTEAKDGHLAVELENGAQVAFGQDRYNHIAHGFAVTIYKSQGVTVDNTLVLAQRSMTQNLAYVAMTRHKKSAQMYYGEKSFPRSIFKGGIVEALSRPAAKTTTLDYEEGIDYRAAVGFGQRRGLNPSNTIASQMLAFTRRQVEKLAKLGERLLKAAPSISRDRGEAARPPEAAVQSPWDREPNWLVPPETSFGRTAEEMAHITAQKSDMFTEAEARARADLGKAFNDVDKILEKYTPSITDASIGNHAFRDGLSEAYETYGSLHGRKGLTASRADRAKRQSAVDASRGTRLALLDMKRAYQSAYGRALSKIETARKTASLGIHKLSPSADKTLKALYSVEGADFEKIMTDNPVEVIEIETFQAAIDKRFGIERVIFKDRDVELTEEQKAHLPKLGEQKTQIKLARSVVDKLDIARDASRSIKPNLTR